MAINVPHMPDLITYIQALATAAKNEEADRRSAVQAGLYAGGRDSSSSSSAKTIGGQSGGGGGSRGSGGTNSAAEQASMLEWLQRNAQVSAYEQNRNWQPPREEGGGGGGGVRGEPSPTQTPSGGGGYMVNPLAKAIPSIFAPLDAYFSGLPKLS